MMIKSIITKLLKKIHLLSYILPTISGKVADPRYVYFICTVGWCYKKVIHVK